jgi:hypothetical protein
MTVDHDDRGWWVLNGNHSVAGPFQTNAAAWHWLERHNDEPITPAEHRRDYGWRMFVNGE